MCRWIAHRGEPIYLENLLFKPANSLIRQSLDCREGVTRTNGDGFGIGWYGSRYEPGLYKETLPAWNDCNLRNLSKQIQSQLFFAHVRASTGTETARQNCHPFTWRQWMFMHNGKIGGYELCKRDLENQLSDELYRLRRGSTDSELIFLLMIQNGLVSNPQHAISATIEQITGIAASTGTRESLQMTVCFTDGKNLFACRHGSSATPPSLYWSRTNRNVLLASEPLCSNAASWNEVQPDEFLEVSDRIYIRPIFEAVHNSQDRIRLSAV